MSNILIVWWFPQINQKHCKQISTYNKHIRIYQIADNTKILGGHDSPQSEASMIFSNNIQVPLDQIALGAW